MAASIVRAGVAPLARSYGSPMAAIAMRPQSQRPSTVLDKHSRLSAVSTTTTISTEARHFGTISSSSSAQSSPASSTLIYQKRSVCSLSGVLNGASLPKATKVSEG